MTRFWENESRVINEEYIAFEANENIPSGEGYFTNELKKSSTSVKVSKEGFNWVEKNWDAFLHFSKL